jgi:hypothetical protein
VARGDDWVTQYLPKLIQSGLSPTAALREFRRPADEGGIGGRIATQTWYQAWGETLAALQSQEQVMRVPLGRAPTAQEETPYSSRGATGRLYSFDVLVRNRATGETYYTPSGYRTNQRVTYATAMTGAISAIQDAAEQGSPSAANLQILGALPIEVRVYVPGAG